MRNRFTLERDGNRWLLLDDRHVVALIDLDEDDLVSLHRLFGRYAYGRGDIQESELF